jgi:hypothetical protein
MSRRRRIQRHLAKRAPTVDEVFTVPQVRAFRQWRDEAEARLAHRNRKPANVDRDAELAQWRAVWATPDVEVRR